MPPTKPGSDGPQTGPVRRVRQRCGARLRARLGEARRSLRPPADAAPLVEAAPPLTLRQIVARFWPWLRPLRLPMLAGAILLVAAPVIEIAEVVLFQRLVDDVLVPADPAPLVAIAALYVGFNLASAVVSGVDDYLSTWISQRFTVSLRTDVFRRLLAQPQHVHDQRRLGDVLSRLTSDVSAVGRVMISDITDAVSAIVRLVAYIAALLWLSWQLTLASLVVVPLFWLVSTRFARLVRTVSRERIRRGGSLSAVAEEFVANVPLVQAYARQDDAVRSFHRQNQGIADAELAASRVRSVFLPVIDLAELAGLLAVVGLGTWVLATDRMTLGGLLAFLTLMAQTYRPGRELGALLPAIYSATAGIERVAELLDGPVVDERENAATLTAPVGRIELDDVTVRYPGTERDALRAVSLSAAPGEVVAIVGASGAGKTTVLRLLTRGAEPSSGRVRLDGHDLHDLRLSSLRSAVAVVLQETLLLDASIYDNIAYPRPDATAADVEAAARAADAHGFISRLPHGYHTRVGQRGRALSGGQRQRIAIARALLCDSPVLLLDEPTAGLDRRSAEAVLTPLRAASRDRTVILVTHDPAALPFADRVIHLDDGAVVALAVA